MTILAIAAGKLTAWATRATRRGGGTSLPGKVALRICPDLPSRLAAGLPRGVVLVTGTNGKTTTSKMLAGILRAAGLRVVRNVAGANLRQGLTSTLLQAARLTGRIRADVALLEVDEGAAPREIRALRPRVLVITNLFRDQLDRYGELATTARKLAEAVADGLPRDSALVANADDPLVWWIAEQFGGTRAPFGLACIDRALATADHASDSSDCESCGEPLRYGLRFGSHIGHWECPGCGRRRPEPAVQAERAVLTEALAEQATLCWEGGERAEMDLPLPGLHNVANATAAATAATVLGVAPGRIAASLEETGPAFGRLEPVAFEGDRTAHLMLVKNPAGLNETARLIRATGRVRPGVLCLNDNTADGHDVSWIWDADLECLAGWLDPVVASGTRAHDMALRLKYAGFAPERIVTVEEPRAALAEALDATPGGGHVYVLPTYTAMLDLRVRLEAEGRVGVFWEEL